MTAGEERLLRDVVGLCDLAEGLVGPIGLGDRVASIRDRLHEPLRVAIAGRTKAGKSTLLNALVGERIAPTDAGECTRIVTWYRRGDRYGVEGVLRDGTIAELDFHRDTTGLTVDLGGRGHGEFDRLDVRWPSRRLGDLVLIDTPGLGSTDEVSADRSRELLGLDPERGSEVDAVVYLLQHIHRSAASFVASFADRSLSRPSPVNAVAVLSRADEVGAGRRDAMLSAASVARRWGEDTRLRALCAAVVPVAGLVAEAAATLREDDAAALRRLVQLADADVEALLLSVDRFMGSEPLEPDATVRRDLLRRLGIFGVRVCIALLAAGTAHTAADLARELRSISGVDSLLGVLEDRFGARAQVLKARTALVRLREILAEVEGQNPNVSRDLKAAVERVEAGAHEFAELELLQLVRSGAVDLSPEEQEELVRLVSPGDVARRLGEGPDAPATALEATVVERIGYWRDRAGHPLTDRSTVGACETAAHSYERLHAELRSPSNHE